MRPPKKIYIWNCEDQLSRSWYEHEHKAMGAVVKRFTLPECFGLPAYYHEKEVKIKDERIKALELECFDMFLKITLLHTLNDGGKIKIRSFEFDSEKYPLAKELASKKEST